MKKKMGYLSFVLILLVISIPVSSASAFAQILNVRAYGQDRFFDTSLQTGYLRGTDRTTIEALLNQPNVNVNQVTVEGTPFTSCVTTGSNSNCTLNYPQFRTAGGEYPYTVSFSGSSRTGLVIVDDLAPVVNIVSMVQISKGNISINYGVTESAYSPTGQLKCSGVKKVEFTSNNNIVRTLNLNNPSQTNCVYTATDTVSIPDPGINLRTVCVKVTDNINNIGQACREITVDNAAPLPSNLKVLDQNKLQLQYIAAVRGVIPVTVSFDLNERSLSSIKADLSDLTEIALLKPNYENKNVVCTPSNCSGSCTCESEVVDLQLPSAGTVNIKLTGRDSAGNELSTTIPYQFIGDNVAPALTGIRSTALHQGRNYINRFSNKITATFEEAGSGIDQNKIYMDLSSLMGSQFSLTSANPCTRSGNTWVCEWEPVTAASAQNDQTFPIAIVYPSQDNAGNLIQGQQTTVTVDSVAPDLINETKIGAGGPAYYPQRIIKEGDSVQLSIIVNDTLPVRAWVNYFYVTGKGTVQGSCDPSPTNGRSRCVWGASFDSTPARAGLNLKLPLTVIDAVGNNATYEIPIDVLGLETGVADYWSLTQGAASPAQIDRQTVTLYDPFVYQEIILNKRTGTQLYPLDLQLGKCTESTDTTYLKRQPRIDDFRPGNGVDVGQDPYRFYIKYELDRSSPPQGTNSINIKCPLNIITKVAGTRVSTLENESVSVTINYYNNPLGEISNEIQKKINDTKDSTLAKLDWLDDVEKALNYAKTLCGVVAIWNGVAGVWAGVRDLFAGCSATVAGSPFCGPPAAASGTAANVAKKVAKKSWTEYANTYVCKPVNCQMGLNQWFLKSNYENTVVDAITRGLQIYARTTGVAPLGAEATRTEQMLATNRPEDSIFWSALFLCLPGLIHNANKWREIQCMYILCLKETANGLPSNVCDQLKGFEECKYFFGQIFNIIPFANAISAVGQALGRALSDPAGIINFALSPACDLLCITPPPDPATGAAQAVSGGCLVCSAFDMVNLIADVTCDIFGISYDGQKRCDNIVDRYNNVKQTKSFCKEAGVEE